MHPVTMSEFEDWQQHPVTVKLKDVLRHEREIMKEGIVHDQYEDEHLVKGMCKSIENFLSVSYEDLFNE